MTHLQAPIAQMHIAYNIMAAKPHQAFEAFANYSGAQMSNMHGLGNIGPEASKPVMEGKGVLFKKFAGIDVFDIEINEEDPDEFIKIVKSLEPTFGGINLEDIKAPESFQIETELREKMNIPIMHDDQHGTAIISAAALINALELVGKKIEDISIVVNGAGAAAIACAKLYLTLGAKKENIIMCDSKGVINSKRENLSAMKAQFTTLREVDTLSEALKGADMFLGLSVADIVTPEDIKQAAIPVLQHRVIVTPEREMEGVTTKQIIKQIIEAVEIPR